MAQLAAAHPFFLDPLFPVLSPRIDFRGTSATSNGEKIQTTVLKEDQSTANKVDKNVTSPGSSFFLNLKNTNLGDVEIGSDTLFEIKQGLEKLDFGELPPVERSQPRGQNFDGKIPGTEREDTGQTPVKLRMGFNPRAEADAAALGILTGDIPNRIPNSFLLPKIPVADVVGNTLDLIA